MDWMDLIKGKTYVYWDANVTTARDIRHEYTLAVFDRREKGRYWFKFRAKGKNAFTYSIFFTEHVVKERILCEHTSLTALKYRLE